MTSARIIDSGLMACFPAGLTFDNGEQVHAEISAVVFDGRRLLMGSDKPVPGRGRSSVFALECPDYRPLPETVEYFTAARILEADKFEDFALTAAGGHMLASTGFDRVDHGTGEQHNHNNLLIWPSASPDAVQVVAARGEHGVRSSVSLRQSFAAALDAPYFKVEGLAAIPGAGGGDHRLLFGIREVGTDHENFEYGCQVIAAPYRVDDDRLVFTGAFELVHGFDADKVPGVRFPVGVSSLEYDRYGERVFWLTSYEVDDADGVERIGGYLWVQSLAEFNAGAAPELIHHADGRVLEFENKAEGVAVLDAQFLFVCYDNDRHTELGDAHARDERKPHEAPYTLLKLE